MQVKLSVTIITFNEEANIERCLKSVEGVADEIVVVDSLSTDRTKEICLKYGAVFVENAFEGFSEQKNFANAIASHNYILSLDADEALTEELRQAILHVKSNSTADAYKMNRLTCYRGKWIKHSGWYPDCKLRLFDKTKGAWVGKLHESIQMSGGSTVEKLKGDILHYYSHNVKQHLDQINKYTDLFMVESWQKGRQTSVLAILVKPPFRFFKTYFLQHGFLDGFNGFFIAGLSAYTVFLKYTKLYLANKSGGPDKV